jgi:hypothetical protein
VNLDEAFAELPPAILLLGPGGWEAGERLYEQHKSSFSARVAKLDASLARHVREQAYIRPFGKAFRVYLINLDGASDQAQNILLKVLEEPPSAVRFILVATLPPLETILSRCQVLTLAPAERSQAADRGPERSVVRIAVRAARDGQLGLLGTAMAHWDDGHTAVLRAWAAERAADRWIDFDEEFAPGATVRQALVILGALSAYAGARSAPMVALEKAFSS